MADIGSALAGMPITMDSPQIEVTEPVLQQRKGMWAKFMGQMQDPNFRQALMATGVGMMRSPQVGESGWDVAGTALNSGIGTLRNLRAYDSEQGRLNRREALDTKVAEGNISTQAKNAGTYETSVTQQGAIGKAGMESQQFRDILSQTELAINADLKKRGVAADEKRADAAMISAEADKDRAKLGFSGSQSTQVALVNMRAQALRALNPKLSPEEANLQAQNELILGKGKSPGQFALDLFKTSMEARQNDLSKIGQPITQQEVDQMRTGATDIATQFFNLGRDQGATTAAGTIDRTGATPPALPSPGGGGDQVVGKKIQDSMGNIAEIISQDAQGVVTLRKPDGSTARVPLEQITPYIMAE